MMKIMAIRPSKVAVYAAAGSSSKTTPAAAKTLKALNITKSNLVGSQEGSATRNVDGIVSDSKLQLYTGAIQAPITQSAAFLAIELYCNFKSRCTLME